MKQMIPHIGFIFKRNIRDKKNIYYIIMMSLCSFLLLCALFFYHMYNYSEKWDRANNIYYRQLMVSPGYDEAMKFFENPKYDFHMEKLLEIEHVVDIHESDYDTAALKNIVLDNNIHGDIVGLNYGNYKIIPKVIQGESFDIDDKNVLICPNKMYLYSYNYSDEVRKKEIIDTRKYIGKTIKGYYDIRYYDEKSDSIKTRETKENEFKIIGIYDVESTNNQMSQCYAPGEQVKTIRKETTVSDGTPSFGSWRLTVDKVENLNEIKNKLEHIGYIVSVAVYTEFSTVYTTKLICNTIIFISIFALLFISLAYIKKKILNNLYIIGLTKSLGYKSKEIKSLYLLDNANILLMSFLLSILFFIIATIIINVFFIGRIGTLGIRWHLALWPFITSLLIMTVFSSLVNYYYISKRIKKNPTTVLNGDKI